MPDFMPHHSGLIGRLGGFGKRIAPAMTRIATSGPLKWATAYLTMYLNVLQGKGSGSGWDIDGETTAVSDFITVENPVLFDVGAHSGDWSNEMRKRFPLARIVQFEPNPENAALLRRSTDLSTTLIEAAVSDTAGSATLHISKASSDTSSLVARRESIFQNNDYEPVEVRMVTIDETVSELGLEKIDFIKLDIEGNELAALRGAQNCLKNGMIRSLAFEFGSGNINTRTYFHDFWDLLHPLGFKFLRICPGGRLLHIDRYYEDLEYFRNVTNYIVTRF